MQQADNVDIDDEFKVRRRKGLTSAVAGTSLHSLWSNKDNTRAFYIDNGVLKELTYNGGAYSSNTVKSGLSTSAKMYFTEVNEEIYFSNGAVHGKIDIDGNEKDWAVELPASTPTLTYSSSGSLIAGRYSVVTTFVHSDGRESGSAKTAATIELTSGGGITVSNLPTAVSSNITKVRIYMTPVNGDMFYFVKEVTEGTTSTTIAGTHTETILLQTHLLSTPSAGKYLCYHRGCIYYAKDKYVHYTEPTQYHLENKRSNWYPFPSEVKMVASVLDGLFVSDEERTYFIAAGDGKEMPDLETVSDFPAIACTPAYIHSTDLEDERVEEVGQLVVWPSPEGICVGTPRGKVINLTEKRIEIGDSSEAAIMLKKQNGITQITTMLRGQGGNNLYASDRADATVIKHNERIVFQIMQMGDSVSATVA